VRYLILADIHANVDAFDAVMEHAQGRWDRALVLGDLVGYGAEPNVIVDRIREMNPDAIVRGNHDKAACGIDDGSQFNHVARLSAIWTGEQLTPGNLDYLRALPMGPIQIDALTEICHGAPFDEDHYIFDPNDARMAMQAAERPLCLFGHTHLPAIYRKLDDLFEGTAPEDAKETRLPLQRGVRYLVNVGSIGQPRDGDPRAGYGVLDDEERDVRLFRLPYDVEKAQARIRAAGLPASLANRLAVGR
jgi:diadenosine tetraphosphatase ApaH/serine/threonine PP2A family protein phosphatase